MNNIQTEISNDIRNAKHSIKVAVSWLTDIHLITELINAQIRGVNVVIIVSSNELNIIRFEYFQRLIDLGAIVNKEGSEDADQGDFMHYKFYIIDDIFAKSGSYNMSMNATTNRETIDEVPVSKKLSQFNDCLKNSVNFFNDIENPAAKKAELALIEKEHKDSLTPEELHILKNPDEKIEPEEDNVEFTDAEEIIFKNEALSRLISSQFIDYKDIMILDDNSFQVSNIIDEDGYGFEYFENGSKIKIVTSKEKDEILVEGMDEGNAGDSLMKVMEYIKENWEPNIGLPVFVEGIDF